MRRGEWAEAAPVSGIECVGLVKSCPGGEFPVGAKVAALGIRLRGFPAWFAHRTYHVSRVPTLNRKVRVLTDWTIALLFRREIVSLGAFQDPQADFRAAAAPLDRAG